MRLRKLEEKDAPLMLEWMHNKDVVSKLGTNFAEKTLDDCKNFISSSLLDDKNLHLAIVDENDEYMGTVSLKHIDKQSKNAEFAITVRSKAMGKGFSKFGMQKILQMGLEELNLDNIYWCVSTKNERAVRFYDKNGYKRTNDVPKKILEPYCDNKELYWYVYN